MGGASSVGSAPLPNGGPVEVSRLSACAVRHYLAGKLRAAERACRDVLALDPDHVQSLQLLKVIAPRLGQMDAVPSLLLKIGMVFLAQGSLDAAAAYFTEITTVRPELADAYHYLGITAGMQGKLNEAKTWFEHLLTLKPNDAWTHNNLGLSLQKQGQLDQAVARFQQAIKLSPDLVVAHNNLAMALAEQGRLDDAIVSHRRALALKPNEPATLFCLAVAFAAQSKLGDAIDHYQRALAIRPDYAEAHNNLANVFEKQDRLDDAIVHYRRALAIRPAFAETRVNLGLILAERGMLDEATAEANTAARLADHPSFPHMALGLLFSRCGLTDAARTHFSIYLQRNPDDRDGARMMLARLGFGPLPERAPDPLLQSIYGRRAALWDRNVTGAISYRGAALVAEALGELAGDATDLDILDAGCGTGLVGSLVVDRAARLEGVDSSQAMLDQAEAKRIYHALHCGDLVEFMRGRPARYDVVTCAATLIHFGDLRPAFDAAATALRDRGLLVLTVFPNEQDDEVAVHNDVGLAYGGSYVHGRAYLRRAAGMSGFTVERIEAKVHEHYRGQPRMCLLVGLRRITRGSASTA